MPYLNSKIRPEDHKQGCPKSKVMRLCAKGNNKKGNRTWITRGLECLNCGVVIMHPYQHIPTKKQRDKQIMSMPKLPKILNENENFQIPKNKVEIEYESIQFTKEMQIKSLKQLRTTDIQNVISRKERKYHNKVRALNTMYKNDEKRCPCLKGKINWDPKLVERFLDVRPLYYEIIAVLQWPPLWRDNNRWASRYRGWIPSSFGHITSDLDYFTYLENKQDPDKQSTWEKLVIEEARGRMKHMETIIKKHHESKIQIYHPVQDEDKKQIKKEIPDREH